MHQTGDVLQNPEARQLLRTVWQGLGGDWRPLVEGMVLTIEPGCYIRPAEDIPEAFWNIGIRIEDDAIVTATGCELITRDVPVAPDAIEALMRG